ADSATWRRGRARASAEHSALAPRGRAAHARSMETVTLDERGLVGISEALDGRGPLVLCLHGFPDIPETFRPLMSALASRGFRVVAPYLRGCHPSTLEGSVDLDTLVADVVAWADRLSPERPVHLVGHDWGAVITHLALMRHAPRFAA